MSPSRNKLTLDRAISEAEEQVRASKEARFIHHNASGDLVVLPYATHSTVFVVGETDVARAEGASNSRRSR